MTVSVRSLSRQCTKYLVSTTLALALGGAATAANVKVEFSDSILEKMDRINALEMKEEAIFRETRTAGRNAGQTAAERFRGAQYGDQNWANEQLFPDIESFQASRLFEVMISNGLKEVDPSFDGTVELYVDKLRISGFPLATLRAGHRTQAEGVVRILDAAGELVAEHEIWTGVRPKKVTKRGYSGPGYKYIPAQMSTRLGPIAAEFTERALEALYPDYDAPGAVSAGG